MSEPYRTDAAMAPARAGSSGCPFSPTAGTDYCAWRAAKLAAAPQSAADLIVPIADLANPTAAELDAARALIERANMLVYRAPALPADAARQALSTFARIAGLADFEAHRTSGPDGIVPIEVTEEGPRAGFIPFSSRAINWHTDGYYNYQGPERCIRAMVLHCVRSAAAGGESGLFDPEIAYIRLRDRDPAFIAALMHPQAMTIPAHEEATVSAHGAVTGPVFAVHPVSGALIMRLTIRKRNVIWRNDPALEAALEALADILANDPLVYRLRLEPGMGVLCNNVLHDRRAFEDTDTGAMADGGRLLYRIRSYNAVFETARAARH